MREWLLDLWDFVIAVKDQWSVLVSGGVLVGLIAFFEHYTGRSVSGWPLWTATILSLLAAVFSAWRIERQKWKQVRQELLELQRLSGPTPISITPKELVSVFNNRTTMHGQTLAKTYEGKWLRSIGAVQDIELEAGLETLVTLKTAGDEALSVFLRFGDEWASIVGALKRGDVIEAVGQINTVTRSYISLRKCELMEGGVVREGQKKIDQPAKIIKQDKSQGA